MMVRNGFFLDYVSICRCFLFKIDTLVLQQERLPFSYNKSDLDQIKYVMNTPQNFSILQAFKNVSGTINNATGNLPPESIPHLQKLAISYAQTSQTFKVGFADACAVLSKFVIKSWLILRRGMNQRDKDSLINLKNQLNIDFTNISSEFIETARSSLINIFSQLFIEVGGQQAKDLLNKTQNLEIQLEEASKELVNITSQLSAVDGDIDSLTYRMQYYDKAAADLQAAQRELKAKLNELQQQVPYYQQLVKKHRDSGRKVRRTGFLFFWRRETIQIDNGEKIAKENLDRLYERIDQVKRSLRTQSKTSLTKEKNKILKILQQKRNYQKILQSKYQPIQLRYDELDREFNSTVSLLNQISHSNEHAQNQATESVDQLSDILRAASDTIISVSNKLNSSLEKLEQFPSALVEAVSDATQFICMADQYSNSMVLDDIKRIINL